MVRFARWIQELNAAFTFAIIGLALSRSAYMAEIVARGCGPGREGRPNVGGAGHVVDADDDAHRVAAGDAVIIPPTNNEVISMLKTTSLVTAVPFSLELYGARDIAGVIFEPIPLLLVASTWYLLVASILMVGQFYLERYYAGASRQLTARQLRLSSRRASGRRTNPGDRRDPDRTTDGARRPGVQELRVAQSAQGHLAGGQARW